MRGSVVKKMLAVFITFRAVLRIYNWRDNNDNNNNNNDNNENVYSIQFNQLSYYTNRELGNLRWKKLSVYYWQITNE